MRNHQHKLRRIFVLAPAMAVAAMAVGASGAATASANTSSCLCFHAVYTDTGGMIHDSAYDVSKKSWSDQVVPGSVPAEADPYAVKTADNHYHVVYVDKAGNLHDDSEDPATKAWSDVIPPGSAKAAASVPVVLDFFAPTGGYTQHIVYVGLDGWIHNDQFDPKAKTWFDQIPPGSVKASSGGPSAVDEGNGYFRIVYVGTDLRVHQARFDDNTPKFWANSIVPLSVPAANGYTRVGFANDPTPGFHVVYLGQDLMVHNDREDLGTGTWYDQIPPGSIGAFGIPTHTLGPDGHDHVVYWGSDGFVHNDSYDPVTRSWFDQIPPGSSPTEANPNALTTYDDTFQVVYVDSAHRLHDDVFTPWKGTWSDTIPTGSVKVGGIAPSVANTDI